MARPQHQHIPTVLNAGARDGLPYYIMPYVAGESLRTRIERGGRLGCRKPSASSAKSPMPWRAHTTRVSYTAKSS